MMRHLGAICLIFVVAMSLASAAIAQPSQPGQLLVYPRFVVDERTTTHIQISRVLEFGTGPVEIDVFVLCPGVEGICEVAEIASSPEISPGQTISLNLADFQLPCPEGFVVVAVPQPDGAFAAAGQLIGSYEIEIGGKGSSREADIAIVIQNPEFGEAQLIAGAGGAGLELTSDFRSIAIPNRKGVRQEGSYLIVMDLTLMEGSNSQSRVSLDWRTADAEEGFSTSFRFTCFARVRLDEINRNFLEENLGSKVGWLRVRARDGAIIAAAISEFGKSSNSIRNMFDSGLR